ncbi:urease subunit beta [Polynucleobacter kasalickyi]|uniref:Urease subunit beta n=1 Tax=Polynucleobacter kasalickyi TaxID=1938817 RepID=A0A1W2BB33_9BURK|nr:urease subunit beta [Polynucleobacter kasalickyi]SMC70243.1 urease subunit beta [Polynucleobacter kasalickyi]
MIPGEIRANGADIEINVGRKVLDLVVANSGDRPIQVGSHFHFFEVNTALQFDRDLARGYRLNIASGTAIRFEPGQKKSIQLVQLDGDQIVYGFNGLVMGKL